MERFKLIFCASIIFLFGISFVQMAMAPVALAQGGAHRHKTIMSLGKQIQQLKQRVEALEATLAAGTSATPQHAPEPNEGATDPAVPDPVLSPKLLGAMNTVVQSLSSLANKPGPTAAEVRNVMQNGCKVMIGAPLKSHQKAHCLCFAIKNISQAQGVFHSQDCNIVRNTPIQQ